MPVHEISDFRAGEGVPLQHVSDQRPTLWSGPHTHFNRETSEDLVPEPEDENEEDEQGEERQRAALKSLPFDTFVYQGSHLNNYIDFGRSIGSDFIRPLE